jgi:hypothetical protein
VAALSKICRLGFLAPYVSILQPEMQFTIWLAQAYGLRSVARGLIVAEFSKHARGPYDQITTGTHALSETRNVFGARQRQSGSVSILRYEYLVGKHRLIRAAGQSVSMFLVSNSLAAWSTV